MKKVYCLYFLLFLLLGMFAFGKTAEAVSLRFVNNTDYYNAQCGTTAATYGNYYGYGPGNTHTGGNVYYGSGKIYVNDAGQSVRCPDLLNFATELFINIGTPIAVRDLTSIELLGVETNNNNPLMYFYVSENGSTWHQLSRENNGSWKNYTQATIAQFPITQVKYLKVTSALFVNRFEAFIHYNNDTTPPTSSGLDTAYASATTSPFRVHMYNIHDDNSGVNRVEYWSRKVRQDGVDEGWIHHGSGQFWNDGVGGIDSYMDIPNRGEGKYEIYARVYDNAGNVAGPWNTWITIDQTNPTYSAHTVTGRKLNTSTFRLEVNGVMDNLSGARSVFVGAWTEAEGVGNAKWYDFVNAGGGTWIIDIPISNHGNYGGNYYANIYLVDHANNQVMIPTLTTIIDRTYPTLVSHSIVGAPYVNGNHFWVGASQEFELFIRGNDTITGVSRILHSLERSDESGTLVREFGHFDVFNNVPVETKLVNFTATNHQMTYNVGREKEVSLKLRSMNINTIVHYEYRYNMHDGAGNNLYQWNGLQNMDTGKKLSIDGEKPTGSITPNSTGITKNNVVLTATGNDGAGSGIKRIQLPDGNYVSGSNATYTVSSNGTYAFIFEDNVGNVLTKSLTVSNIDKTAPSITFTPEKRDAELTDIEIQTAIADSGVSGYKAYRYVWSKDETKPTEGWSDWDTTSNPMITQSQGGKWVLHIEAMDHAGNIGYAFSGLYEKIVLSSGPSITINVFPLPTGQWMDQPIDVYVMDSGDSELLAKANKFYEVTNSPLYPSEFSGNIPLNKKVQLNLQGENFIHIHYILDDGTKISSTSGPYLIDTGAVGDFEMKLVNASDVEVTTWTNVPLKLVMSNPSIVPISGMKKEYRIEGLHNEWQSYTDGTVISAEGDYRVFGRIISGTGNSSPQQVVNAKIDHTKPAFSAMKLVRNVDNTYEVRLKAADTLSGVKEVSLKNGTNLTPSNHEYAISGLTTQPTGANVTDVAGNTLSMVSFAVAPTITFDAPYTLDTPLYRSDVVVNLTNATGYLVGTRAYTCSSDPCKVTLSQNTTLTAVRTEGVKETRVVMKIDNIDQSNLNIFLAGKRSALSPTNIEFTWDYALSSGTLACTEEGQNKTYAVSGKAFALNGKNYTYECSVTGNYQGITIVSNTVTIYPDHSIALEGDGGASNKNKTTNVFLEETHLGNVYLINGRSDNYKYNTLPLPDNEITAN